MGRQRGGAPPNEKTAARAVKARGDGRRRRSKTARPTYHALADLGKALDCIHRPIEREITDGRRYLGTVREHPDGGFVAIMDDHVVGGFATIAEATDAIIESGTA